MGRFRLKKIDEIVGKISFYMLIKDKICLFEEFEKVIIRESTFKSELDTIQTRMIQISNLVSMPDTKLKDITHNKDPYKNYEIKTKNLRVYYFKDFEGNIIVIGGKKSTQKKDIKKFKNILKEYYINSEK